MRQRRLPLSFLALTLGIAACAVAPRPARLAAPQPAATAPHRVPELGSRPLRGALAGGEAASYRFSAPAGVYLEARLEAGADDLALTLRPVPEGTGGDAPGPGVRGETIGDERTVVAWTISRAAGTWEVVVRRPPSAGPAEADFRLRLAARRPPTEAERDRLAARASYERGWELWLDGRFAEAAAEFDAALAASTELGYLRGQAEAHHGMGEVLRATGDHAGSFARFEAAVELWRRVPDQEFLALALQQLGHQHAALDRPDAALESFGAAIELAERADDAGRVVRSLFYRCELLHLEGRLLEALADCERASDLGREGRDEFAPRPLILLGEGIYRNLGDLERAEDALERALELLGTRPGAEPDQWRALALNGLGMIRDYRGDYEEAIRLYSRALELLDPERDAPQVTSVLHNTGTAYKGLGRLDKMLEYYRRAAAVAPNEERRLSSLLSINYVLVRQGLLEEAGEVLSEALELAARVGSAQQRALAAERHGETLLAAGRAAEAMAPIATALELYRRSENRWGEAHAWETLAEAHAAQGDDEAALEALRRALGLNQVIGDLGEQAENLFAIARIERRRGRRAAALAAIEEVLELAETLRLEASHDQVRSFVGANAQPYHDLYVDLLMERHAEDPGRGHDREAWRAHERARARSLLDLLAEQRREIEAREIPADLLEERADLVRRLDAVELERRLLADRSGSRETDEELRRLRIEIDQLLTSLRDLEGRSRQASPRYDALTSVRPATLAEIQRTVLDPHTLLVELRLGGEQSFLWAIDAGGLRSFVLPPRRTIETTARCVYLLLIEYGPARSAAELPDETSACLGARRHAYGRPPSGSHPLGWRRDILAESFDATSRELSAMLLGPLDRAGLLAHPRLAIVADGTLEYVPFAALPRPGTDPAEPLLVSHEIVHLPSATVAAFLAGTDRAPPEGELALIADPVYHRGDPRLEMVEPPGDPGATTRGAGLEERLPALRRLPFAGVEARTLLDLFGPERSWSATGPAATREAVLRAPLDRYRFVHFATHGVLDAVDPELSGLVLSTVRRDGSFALEESTLRLHDVYRLRLAADLVVLSACETALGPAARGEGLLGLARAFMHAGAERVIASLWQVQDRATAELVGHLYRGLLREERSAADALRRAQLALYRNGAAHPYYWAGLVLQGDWR